MPARGRHICALTSTFDEQCALAAPFLQTGLARGESVVYLVHDHDRRDVERALAERGIALRRPRRPGVELKSCDSAGLARLPFSAGRLVARWDGAVDKALAVGYAGLRVVAEMTWALYGGLERLGEFELSSARLFAGKPISALCLYNRLRFAETVLRDALFSSPAFAARRPDPRHPDRSPCEVFLARAAAPRLNAARPARNGRPSPLRG